MSPQNCSRDQSYPRSSLRVCRLIGIFPQYLLAILSFSDRSHDKSDSDLNLHLVLPSDMGSSFDERGLTTRIYLANYTSSKSRSISSGRWADQVAAPVDNSVLWGISFGNARLEHLHLQRQRRGISIITEGD